LKTKSDNPLSISSRFNDLTLHLVGAKLCDSMREESTQRIFCAVDISDAARRAAAARIATLGSLTRARVGWEKPEKMHLTLKFLGETEAARVTQVKDAAVRAAQGLAPFVLAIKGAGVFPPRGAARVLWLGVEDASGGLARLQQRLENDCAALGFPREKRAFKAHLTLARARAPEGAGELARRHQDTPFAAVEFTVGELLVLRSELGPGGSRHTTLARCPLRPVA
jgi:2'-5' RNA ligase